MTPEERKEKIKEYVKKYSQTSHGKLKRKEWLEKAKQTKRFKVLQKERFKRYLKKQEGTDKYEARKEVQYALRSGEIKKQPCFCGEIKVEGHHHNGYTPEHWIDVIWLCRTHHFGVHKEGLI